MTRKVGRLINELFFSYIKKVLKSSAEESDKTEMNISSSPYISPITVSFVCL